MQFGGSALGPGFVKTRKIRRNGESRGLPVESVGGSANYLSQLHRRS